MSHHDRTDRAAAGAMPHVAGRRPGARRTGLTLAAAVAASLALPAGAAAAAPEPEGQAPTGRETVRVASYTVALNRQEAGGLLRELRGGDSEQARALAEVLQHTRPDVVLLNEVDRQPGGLAADLLREEYLEVPQQGAQPIDYPYAFTAPVNTGVPSGVDLDGDGAVDGPGDAFGFGSFPGQYGMALLSRYPIAEDDVRTFRELLWKDMPGALLPDDPSTPEPGDYYSPAALDVLRLSSTSHWDVPVEVGGRTVHVLASHPTPPTVDGPQDSNGRRNHDEIRFWADYVSPSRDAGYITDDDGGRGGLPPGEPFVVLGDLNADPVDGDSVDGAVQQLLDSPRVRDPEPTSPGGAAAAQRQGGANTDHEGDPRQDTADFTDDPAPGNLRVDYVLPSTSLRLVDSGVFWPVPSDPLYRLTGDYPFPTSDHRLVWADLRVPGAEL